MSIAWSSLPASGDVANPVPLLRVQTQRSPSQNAPLQRSSTTMSSATEVPPSPRVDAPAQKPLLSSPDNRPALPRRASMPARLTSSSSTAEGAGGLAELLGACGLSHRASLLANQKVTLKTLRSGAVDTKILRQLGLAADESTTLVNAAVSGTVGGQGLVAHRPLSLSPAKPHQHTCSKRAVEPEEGRKDVWRSEALPAPWQDTPPHLGGPAGWIT